jgi:anthranilate synthase component I
MIRLVEHLPDVNPDPLGLPDAVLMRPSVVAVLDGVKGEVTVVAPAWPGSGLSARAAYAQAAERVMDAVRDLDRRPGRRRRSLGAGRRRAGVELHPGRLSRRGREGQGLHPRRRHLPGRALAALGAALPAAALRALPQRCGAPTPRPSCSSSTSAASRCRRQPRDPGAAARRRGDDPPHRRHPPARRHPEEDRALEADLLADPRSGRAPDAARPRAATTSAGWRIGTVRPTEQFVIERYSHVMHIVSNVVGELREGEDALSALLAGLPAGTVSGAPKVRAMEIIDELEPEKRGVYGGGVGYFAANGEMDICIALRTAVLKDGTALHPGRRRRGLRQRPRGRMAGDGQQGPRPAPRRRGR